MMAAESEDCDDFALYRGPIQPYMFEPVAVVPSVQPLTVDAVQPLPQPVTEW